LGLSFEWDRRKAEANVRKHGIFFEEATTVFGDPLSLTIDDPDSPMGDKRLVIVGQSTRGQLLVVQPHDRGKLVHRHEP